MNKPWWLMRDVTNRPRLCGGMPPGFPILRLTSTSTSASLIRTGSVACGIPPLCLLLTREGHLPRIPPHLRSWIFLLCFFPLRRLTFLDPADVDDSRCKLSRNRQSNALTPHGPTRFCLVYPLHLTAYCLFASSLVGYTTIQISTDNRAMDEIWTCQFCSAVFHRLDHHKRHIATRMIHAPLGANPVCGADCWRLDSSQKPFKCGFCGSHYKRGCVCYA